MERIEGWVKKLTSMQDIFDSWLTCQQKWMYLGPVYGSEEIAKQMPKERFEFQVKGSAQSDTGSQSAHGRAHRAEHT